MPTEIEGFPLSPQQERLWQLQSGDAGHPYRVQCAVFADGALDFDALTEALAQVIGRHEILRTTFRSVPGFRFALQVITDGPPPHVRQIDLSHVPLESHVEELGALLDEARALPLDQAFGPLLQLCVVRLSASRHALLFTAPAICVDSQSLRNLVGELAQLYAGDGDGLAAADAVLQYADVAAWQNEMREGEDALPLREYWSGKNLTRPPLVSLPLERSDAGVGAFRPRAHTLRLDADTVRTVEALAERRGVSVEVFLLCCFMAWLRRCGASEEVTLGVAATGRGHEGLAEALGPLSRHVPIRALIAEGQTFDRLLGEVERELAGALESQDGFHWDASAGFDGERAGPPFFPICFEYRDPAPRYARAGLAFEPWLEYSCADRFKLKLTCAHTADGLDAELQYDPRLFAPDDVGRFASQYRALVESALRQPEEALASLELLSEDERRQVLFQFNRARADYTTCGSVQELFEAQAARTPERVAVVHEGRRLTYGELNARADLIARRLSDAGVGPERRVGICMERSQRFVAAMLGVLKAGGAYVPLDPALPSARLNFMLRNSGAGVLLTEEHLLERLPFEAERIICPASEEELADDGGAEPRPRPASPNNLAYIIYTSGSTGEPNGVAVAHAQLLNYIFSVRERLGVEEGDSFALVSTLAADLGYTAVFPALTSGGTLHLLSHERASDSQALAEYFSATPVDYLKIVPSHLAALLTCPRPERLLPLKGLVLGGEASSWELVGKVERLAPDCAIFNHYGPTETTVGVLTYRKPRTHADALSSTLPLGLPLDNTQTYLLDGQMRPVPFGVPGELYIGGACVARGYDGQPGLTAERFVPDSFGELPGGRLYRTGDLARRLPEGHIEFLGRVDFQLKIRGFRVELGEVEAVLRQHPGVSDARALAFETPSGGGRIIAYVVVDRRRPSSIKELRRHLKERLPEYMLPAGFVHLPAMPLTPNGKLDRRALSAYAPASLSAVSFAPPRSPVEEALTRIWAEVLKVERVGIHDNFFDLGGNSLHSIEIVARAVCEHLPLTPRQLFRHQTVAELAASIDAPSSEGDAPPR